MPNEALSSAITPFCCQVYLKKCSVILYCAKSRQINNREFYKIFNKDGLIGIQEQGPSIIISLRTPV